MPCIVRGFERLRDLPRDGQRLVERDGAARHALGQVLAFDELHDERPRVAGVLEAVDLRRCAGGSATRASCASRSKRARRSASRRHRRRQDLDRDVTSERHVAGAIDLAHATCAEQRENLIGPETSDRGRGS